MFSLFKSPAFHDAQLGEFVRARGHWRGSLSLDATSTALLVLSGDRSRPDLRALTLAGELPRIVRNSRPAIAQALFEHYEPYARSIGDGEAPSPSSGFPSIGSPAEVWPHVTLLFVSVTPLDGVPIAELGYGVAWDVEHTLGARLRDGTLLELCGSVLPP